MSPTNHPLDPQEPPLPADADADAAAAPAEPVAPLAPMAPLANPIFRMLWLAWFAANTSMWMNDVASAWLMTQLTSSPVMVALVQTASTLPVFLLGLPCGAVADIVDRRRWFMFTQLWVTVTATLLMLASITGTLDATLLLVLVFANGIGLAMRWPVFAAIIPDVVSKRELSAALALNGVSMNMARIIGPLIVGGLIATVGTGAVYALNAVLSVGAAFIIWRWPYKPHVSALPGERFVGAMRVGAQYVRQSQRMRVVLAKIFVFFLQSSALVALLPLVAKRLSGAQGAATFSIFLMLMGAGAVVAALKMQSLREHMNRDALVNVGVLAHAGATAAVAFAPHPWIAMVAMVVAGAAWISVANSLTLSAQLALPNWVRARGMSMYQMALMGGSGVGAALWGYVASLTSVRTSLVAAAATAMVLLWVMQRWHIEATDEPDLTPQRPWAEPTTAYDVDQDAGPVMVTVEYIVHDDDHHAFTAVMAESRRARLQLGALSWGLFRDTKDRQRFIEYFVDETWTEHRRRFDRVTTADVQLRERRLAFHRGTEPPKIERFLGQSMRDI